MHPTYRPRRREDPLRRHLAAIWHRVEILHAIADRTDDETKEMYRLWAEHAHQQPYPHIRQPPRIGSPAPLFD